MVNLYRLICLAILFLASASSFALVPKQSTFTVRYEPGGGRAIQVSTGATKQAACSGIPGVGPGNGYSGMQDWSYAGGDSCSCTLVTYDGQRLPRDGCGLMSESAPSCPANSVASGGQCACTSGFEEIGGACEPKNSDKDACWNLSVTGHMYGGDLNETYRYKGVVPDQKTFCIPTEGLSPGKGCLITFNRQIMYNYGPGAEISEGTLSMSPDANLVDQSCALDPGKDKPPVEKCKSGFTGVVNGVEVCINKVPDSGVGGDKTEDTTETAEETKKVKRDSVTDCKNGNCTTTTTTTTTITKKPGGEVTSTTSTNTITGSQKGFCEANKSSKLCADDVGSSFSGSCSAGFKCEGDAIQCAVSQEQHRRACKLFDDESPESKLYNDNKNKTGNQTGDLPGNETINVAGRINSSDALGAGSAGVADLNVMVWGQAITLPFSMINPYLGYLGNILVAVSLLLAMRIVARG